MLLDFNHKLAYIATQKTASTSITSALRPLRGVAFVGGVPAIKHLSFERYLMIRDGLGTTDFKVWSVIRHPREKFISWFRFRSREGLSDNKALYQGDKTLEDHIKTASKSDLDLCDDRLNVLHNDRGCDILFKYEDIEIVSNFMGQLYPKMKKMPQKNVSARPVARHPDLLAAIDDLLREPIAWYENLTSDTAATAIAKLDKAQ